MPRIAVIVGSTRPGRRSIAVAGWVVTTASEHPAVRSGEATLEIVDLADFALPLLDEALPPSFARYEHPHTQRWAAAIASYDAFVFVTPEYNHSFPAALKNAVDFLYEEWTNKAAGFVSFGLQGGVRAVEHLRPVLGEVGVADVGTQVALSVFTDFAFTDPQDPAEVGTVDAGDHQEPTLHRMLDELLAWSGALEPLRRQAQSDATASV